MKFPMKIIETTIPEMSSNEPESTTPSVIITYQLSMVISRKIVMKESPKVSKYLAGLLM